MTPYILYSIVIIYFKTLNCHGSEIKKPEYTDSVLSLNSSFCEHNACVQKCCPAGKYAFSVHFCRDNSFSNTSLDFSDMKVYSRDRTRVVSTVDKMLTLIPPEFDNMTFLKAPLRITVITKFNLYLTEDGYLYREIPNLYNRWSRYEPKNFCIDYYYNIRTPHIKPIPQMWVTNDRITDELEYKPYQKYGDLVSCFFLLLVFVVYMLLPDLRNLGGKIVMAYVFSLFWSYVFLYILQNYQHNDCMPLALVTYFFFMTTFCWMNTMSFDIWWTFRGYAKTRPIHRRGEVFKFILYCLYACGLPLVMTIGVGVVDSLSLRHRPWIVKPSIGDGGCFLEDGSKFLYLYIPMTILILMNWLFFLMTGYNVWRLCRGTKVLHLADSSSSDAQHKQWSRFMVYLKLSVVMGLSWVFEMLAHLIPSPIWNITDVYNLFIGLAIFIIFVCKKKIFYKLADRFKLTQRKSHYRRSTQNTENVTSNFTVQHSTQRDVCINSNGPEFEVKI